MSVSAVLLAGGESRRMGRDKATLVFNGKPLWRRQLGLLSNLQPQELFLSARIDPVWRPADVHFVADTAPSRGPLSGIATTLRGVRTNHLLVLAIDMPLMVENFLVSLCRRSEPGCGVIPVIGDRTEPLAAIYPKEADSDFTAAVSGPDFSLQSLAQELITAGKLRVLRVSRDEENYFRNFNEPRDLI